jgi:hypothetical protein
MLAPSNIVYNMVFDIIIKIEYVGVLMLLVAPGGARLPKRENNGRKTTQTRDGPNAQIRSYAGCA